jgi:hypothetical protein
MICVAEVMADIQVNLLHKGDRVQSHDIAKDVAASSENRKNMAQM